MTPAPAPGLRPIDTSHYHRGCRCPRCSFIDAIRAEAIRLCANGDNSLPQASDTNISHLLADAAHVIAAGR